MATQSDARPDRWTEMPIGGDPPSFEQHRNALRACAERLLGDANAADAVVDEVLRNAGPAIALFRPPGSLGGWLQGLTIGLALARRGAVSGAPRIRKETNAAPRSRDRSAVAEWSLLQVRR